MSFYIAEEQNSRDKKEAISQLWWVLFFLLQQQKYIAVSNVNTFQTKIYFLARYLQNKTDKCAL